MGGVAVGVAVSLLEKERIPVLLAEGPSANDAVGENDTVELAESVVLGVKEAVPVAEGMGEPVEVGVGELGGVALVDRELLPVLLPEAPSANEAVGEALKAENVTEATMPRPVTLESEDHEMVR